MHPARHSSSKHPTDPQDSPRRTNDPGPSTDPQPPATGSGGSIAPQQQSLPSIKQLHPYLPDIPPHQPVSEPTSSYGYIGPPSYVPPHALSQTAGPRRASEVYGSLESEADDVERREPPKKKRRRQALSCTECKRRKIKCDRSQPCTPCTRRGEPGRCQWHIVEPVEKYVTRAEYEELKARFDELAAQVQRFLPSASSVPPYYQMGARSSMSGASTEAVSTYHSSVHQPLMPPPIVPYSSHSDVPPHHARLVKSEETQNQPRGSTSGSGHQTTMVPTSPVASGHPSLLMRQHRPLDRSPTSAAASRPMTATASTPTLGAAAASSATSASGAKQSPLSLAAITTPYTPDSQQSKNCRAQTCTLGHRLRIGFPAPEDPADHSSATTTPTPPSPLTPPPTTAPHLLPLPRFKPLPTPAPQQTCIAILLSPQDHPVRHHPHHYLQQLCHHQEDSWNPATHPFHRSYQHETKMKSH